MLNFNRGYIKRIKHNGSASYSMAEVYVTVVKLVPAERLFA